ncbi:nucleotidyltransferase domain-containing protein [Nostoc sp.]|uniref:nucleotidyltransferase domain-containing protein n=1 Tax=Nostoc sp. TaxID=1180 RepID=UPI002FFBD7B1
MTLQLLPQECIKYKTASPIANLRPEINLLLCCTRIKIDTSTTSQIHKLLQTDLNWDYLLQKAYQHGVFLLLYESLQKTHPELIPQNISNRLHAYSRIKTARNLFLAKQLCQILDLLGSDNISAIPFKGPTLATLAYGNLVLREFSDLDILVRKDDYLRAKELLIRQGYRHKYFPEHEVDSYQAQLIRDDGKVGIDLHYEMVTKDSFFPLDSTPFWQRLQPLSIAGQTVATLQPEDALLVAYIHGSKEDWRSLKRVCDFAELIRAYPQLNWEQILEPVERLGNKRGFLLALLLACNHLSLPLPEVVSQKFKVSPQLRFLAEQLYQQMVCDAELENQLTPSDGLSFFIGGLSLVRIANTDSFRVRVQYCLDIAFRLNERDRAFFLLPDFLYFLYYPLRWFRLIKTYKFGKDKILNLSKLLRCS